jgi:ABC-type nitrate/sulfonate/bicarbonate transport system substrate-binding protein
MKMRMLYRDVDRLPYLYGVRHYAEKRGLDLTLVRHRQTGREDWGEKLRRGEVDVIGENYWALQRYRSQGVPFVTVASSSHIWTEVLLAAPDIAGIPDLRGKKVAVRLTGPQHSAPAVLLKRAGLFDSVELAVYSEPETGRWGHWKKVADGTCAACWMLPLYAAEARAAGLIEIPYEPFIFEGGHVVPTMTESYIAGNREAVRVLVEAMFDACERVDNDAAWFRERVVDAIDELHERHPEITSDGDIDRAAKILRAEIAAIPFPTAEGIKNAYDVATLQFPEIEGFNSLLMWDLSFARSACGERGASRPSVPAVVAAPPGDIK